MKINRRKFLTVLGSLALFGGCRFFRVRPSLAHASPDSGITPSTKVKNHSDKNVLIAYHSLGGNTKAMAQEIFQRFQQADMIQIRAAEYEGWMGQLKANRDAWVEETTSAIKPETIDMSKYKLIFLGSPIWWYRPSVPLWTFVQKNDFQDQRVVLFNTFNSQFKSEYIQKFQNLIENKKAKLLDHIHVRRGRIYNQLNREAMIQQVQNIIVEKGAPWSNVINQ